MLAVTSGRCRRAPARSISRYRSWRRQTLRQRYRTPPPTGELGRGSADRDVSCGNSARLAEDIAEALWGTRVSQSTALNLNKKIRAKIRAWRYRRIGSISSVQNLVSQIQHNRAKQTPPFRDLYATLAHRCCRGGVDPITTSTTRRRHDQHLGRSRRAQRIGGTDLLCLPDIHWQKISAPHVNAGCHRDDP